MKAVRIVSISFLSLFAVPILLKLVTIVVVFMQISGKSDVQYDHFFRTLRGNLGLLTIIVALIAYLLRRNKTVIANEQNSNGMIEPLVAPKSNSMAIASLLLSASGFLVGPIGSIPGIICGHIARSRIRSNSSVDREGVANAGLILGYVALILFALMLILIITFSEKMTNGPVN